MIVGGTVCASRKYSFPSSLKTPSVSNVMICTDIFFRETTVRSEIETVLHDAKSNVYKQAIFPKVHISGNGALYQVASQNILREIKSFFIFFQ